MADQDVIERRPLAERQPDRQPERQADAPPDDRRVSQPDAPPDARAPAPPARRRSRRGLFILAAILLALAVLGTWWWWTGRDLESTDDAYTDGFTVAIAPQVAGQVIQLAVSDNEFVRKGDVLIRIDPRPFQASSDQAEANLKSAQAQLEAATFGTDVARKNFPAQLALAKARLASAQAQLFKAQTDARRQHAVARGATTQQEVDAADAALMSAQAGVQEADAQVQEASPVEANISQTNARVGEQNAAMAQARAQMETAGLNLEWSVVRAPADGWVTKRGVNLGDYLQAGQSILTLVTPTVWVTANFKETQLARLRAGQKVDLRVDAYPDLRLQGHVDSVQLGSGSRFTAFPAENATGNFVKIVQRIPVKIDIDSGLEPGLPLPLGASVTPAVHLK